jgi:2-oxoglutarate dehydrogenase E1 component
MPLSQLITELETRFAGTVGAEIEHIDNTDERTWLRKEFSHIYNPVDSSIQKHLYTELARADALEKTIATKYIGKKRFSIEGADAQIPALESFLEESAKLGSQEFVVGMAHRGRLTILVNVIGKPLENMMTEWEGYPHPGLRGDGDVKYHGGYESLRTTRTGQNIRISMPFNPSHLEYVGAVAIGETRARQDAYYNSDKNAVVPLLLHGDAAVAGQGVVFETAQMMSLNGYNVGGTIHIVANNQVGFTTDPSDSRSSQYCTDVAKVTGSPVFHVNADDVETLHNVMVLSARYRNLFKKDIYIDIVCFRRYGHNESDEPTFTQPLLYKLIKDKPSPYEQYMQRLISQGFKEEDLKDIYNNFKSEMTACYDTVKSSHKKIERFLPLREFSKITFATEKEMLAPLNSKLKEKELATLAHALYTIPSSFNVNSKLSRIIVQDRKDMAEGTKRLDWGMAELLAYATLLSQGYSVRLVGEDAQRGTFSHRHVTLVDAQTGEIINSLLSEEAAMAYEYGYAISHAKSLVLWEGQFGDFANGAQVVIDQFIAAGESKWSQTQNLVLLLPHGYEGQGPEHSSGRLERFLQLCAQGNMQVACFTHANQLFHALRRQVLRPFRKPLVIMTPKSFLRHARVTTTLEELATSHYEEILDDPRHVNPTQVKRLVFCMGKMSLDLLDFAEKEGHKHTAIVRIEQFYPFALDKCVKILNTYKHAQNIYWVQEEPANMGAWGFLHHELSQAIKKAHQQTPLHYIGRSRRASPAVGLEKLHLVEQEKIIKAAFEYEGEFEV